MSLPGAHRMLEREYAAARDARAILTELRTAQRRPRSHLAGLRPLVWLSMIAAFEDGADRECCGAGYRILVRAAKRIHAGAGKWIQPGAAKRILVLDLAHSLVAEESALRAAKRLLPGAAKRIRTKVPASDGIASAITWSNDDWRGLVRRGEGAGQDGKCGGDHAPASGSRSASS